MSSITVSPLMGMSRPAHLGHTSRAAQPSSTPLRITRRGRAVLMSFVAIPLAAWIAVATLNGGGATATLDDVAALEFVTVHPGQTLWGLAAELAPSVDPREVIDDVMRFNRLGSADIAAGQQLAIPPKYTH